jgi:hypothetical protein
VDGDASVFAQALYTRADVPRTWFDAHELGRIVASADRPTALAMALDALRDLVRDDEER